MSTIRVDTAQSTSLTASYSLTEGVAKSLLVYDQTIPTVRASTNVSAVTDVVTGRFTVDYTNVFAVATDQSSAGSTGNLALGGDVLCLRVESARSTSSQGWRSTFADATSNGGRDLNDNRLMTFGPLA